MRRFFVLAIALAGCFQPSPPRGLACETECPSGEVCVNGFCHPEGYTAPDDAMVDVPMPDADPGNPDLDNDGVLNSVDNCPTVKNADQHDEDGDDFGDLCDPCPFISGDDKDTDTDGVGDECDPNPGVAKERYVLFDPFTANNALWDYQTAPANDVMVTDGDNSTLEVSAKHTRVYIGGQLSGVTAVATSHQLAIFFEPAVSDAPYYYWEGYDNASGQHGIRLMAALGNSMYSILAQVPYPNLLPTGSFFVMVDYNSVSQAFAAKGNVGNQDFTESSGAAQNVQIPMAARIGFGTVNAKATFHFVAVIESNE